MFGEMTTSKRVTFIVGLAVLVIAVVLAWGYVSPSRPLGKVCRTIGEEGLRRVYSHGHGEAVRGTLQHGVERRRTACA